MLKLYTIISILIIFWASPLQARPIPASSNLNDRDKFIEYSPPIPFSELNWSSWFYTWQTLLQTEAFQAIQMELAQLQRHIASAILSTTISNIPNYLIIYGMITGRVWLLPETAILIQQILHSYLLCYTLYSSLFLSPEDIEPEISGHIQSDSLLLNSLLFIRRHLDSQNLTFTANAWPVSPVSGQFASPLTVSLITLYNQIINNKLNQCTLFNLVLQEDRPIVRYYCESEDTDQPLSGSFELFSYCSLNFTDNENECATDLLHPDLVNCLAQAINQKENPTGMPFPCLIQHHSAIEDQERVVKTLSDGQIKIRQDFLVAVNNNEFLFTGQYPHLTSAETLLENYLLDRAFWPSMGATWERLTRPLPDLSHRVTQATTIEVINWAHNQLLAHFMAFWVNSTPSTPTPPPQITITEGASIQEQPDSGRLSAPEDTELPFRLSVKHRFSDPTSGRRGSISYESTIESLSDKKNLPDLLQRRRRSLPPVLLEASIIEKRRGSLTKWRHAVMANIAFRKAPTVISNTGKILSHPDQGLVSNHLEKVVQLSRYLMQAIVLRPINPENIELEPLLHPSKNLLLKNKTANWNFGNGFVPVLPEFSKLTAHPEKMEKARLDVQKLFQDHPDQFAPQQLKLKKSRVLKLLESTHDIREKSHQRIEAIFYQDGYKAHQIAEFIPGSDDCLIFDAEGHPFMVVAHPKLGPYIADYDLLLEASLYSHHVLSPVQTPRYAVAIEKTRLLPDQNVPTGYTLPNTKVIAVDPDNYKEGSFPHLDKDNFVETMTHKTLFVSKQFYQEPSFKPVDLGDYDRLTLPLISPQVVLNRLRPQIIALGRTLDLDARHLQSLLKEASASHYQDLHQLLVTGLIQFYHPGSGALEQLLETPVDQLSSHWQQLFPASAPVYDAPSETIDDTSKLIGGIKPYRHTSDELIAVHKSRSFLMLLNDLHKYTQKMNPILGNLTPRMQKTVKQLNRVLDRGPGLQMFHHGCDAANPFSKPGDVCPATGVLPFVVSSYSDTVMVTELDKMQELIVALKSHGLHVKTILCGRWTMCAQGDLTGH